MKKVNLTILLALFALLTQNAASAQTTGSFDISITFNGAPRQLSLYVPASYDATLPHRLIIGLHGLGDNSANYRNSLVGPLSWPSLMPGTILICPESSTINSDYFSPAGSDSIIQACINFAEATYHIDTADIVLQGFSYGGRAALRYGLDHYSDFKGLLLNTPAIQGVKQALNQTSSYTFNYANAAHTPIYITHGTGDILYESPIDTTYEQLVLNDGKVRYFQFPGMGHTIPPIAQIINFIPFFDTPSAAGFDLDIVKPVVAKRSCSNPFPASVLIRNTGTQTIHTAVLQINTGTGAAPYTWTGSLAPFQHAWAALPALAAPDGTHTLTVTVSSLDGGIPDTVTGNNQKSVPFEVATTGQPLPLFEGFEGVNPPAGWIMYPAGDYYTPWVADSTVARTGIASVSTFNTIFIFENSGRHDDFVSPLIDLTSIPAPHLSYDVAYNYHKYTASVSGIDSIFADTLEVLISTDCGSSYTLLSKKGGSQLATFGNPILNPLTLEADFATPADSNWRTEYLDLSAYGTADKAMVKFRYTSALGGFINIDNISFTNVPVGIEGNTRPGCSLFPSPADRIVNVVAGESHIDHINITDISGRPVARVICKGSSKSAIDTADLPDGLYIFHIFTGQGAYAEKVLVRH